MGLFERLSRVARAELNYAKTQFINPQEEIDLAISMLTDAVIKTRLAIISAPTEQVEALKCMLSGLETKLANTKAKRDELVARMREARMREAKLDEQLQSMRTLLSSSSGMGAFERMEEKALMIEAKSQVAGELAGNDLESQFAMVEAGSDIDDELAAMKAQLTGGSVSQPLLEASEEKKSSSPDSAVDAELESLRSQLKNMQASAVL